MKIDVVGMLGAERVVYATFVGQNVVVRVIVSGNYIMGSELKLGFNMNTVHFFDKDSEEVIK